MPIDPEGEGATSMIVEPDPGIGEMGRPSSIADALRQRLAESEAEVEAIAEALIRGALAGSFPHLREILERIDGKVDERTIGPEGECFIPPVTLPSPAIDDPGDLWALPISRVG